MYPSKIPNISFSIIQRKVSPINTNNYSHHANLMGIIHLKEKNTKYEYVFLSFSPSYLHKNHHQLTINQSTIRINAITKEKKRQKKRGNNHHLIRVIGPFFLSLKSH